MTCLIEREHDVAAPCELDGKAALCFARVDIAVYGEDRRRPSFGGNDVRHVQQSTQTLSAAVQKLRVVDRYRAARGLNTIGDECAGWNEQYAEEWQEREGEV